MDESSDDDNGTPIEPEVRTEYVPSTYQERAEYSINEGEEEDKENLPPYPPTPSDNGRERGREIAPTAQEESPAFRQAVAYCESMSAARVSERLKQRIQNALAQFGERETLKACQVALDHGAHSWQYVERVLAGSESVSTAAPPRVRPRASPVRASPGPMAPVYNSATEQYERLNPETRAWEAVEQDDQGNWRVIPWLSGGGDDGTSD